MSRLVLPWNSPSIIRHYLGQKGLQEYRLRKAPTEDPDHDPRKSADKWLRRELEQAGVRL